MTEEQRPEVVEFGSTERLSRRAQFVRAFGATRHMRLVVPVAAALGALALFGSLVSDWQTVNLTEVEGFRVPEESRSQLDSGLADLAGWTAGYLMGIFALVGCAGLVLFGAPAARRQARVLGLTTAGALTGLVAAMAVYLDDTSPALLRAAPFGFSQDDVAYDLTYGRGVTFAFLGIGTLTVALYLAGRFLPAAPATSAAEPTTAPAAAGASGAAAEEDDWPWRRPGGKRAGEQEAELPEQPIDLTVAPTAPFVPLGEGSPADGSKPGGKDPQ